MTKPKTKQLAPSGQRNWFWRHKIMLALLLIVFAIGVWWQIDGIVRQKRADREQSKERATFAAIQKDIYALGDSMTGLGEVKKDSYCYYTSNTTPWEKGDRYCNVNFSVSVTVQSRDEAIDQIRVFKTILNKREKVEYDAPDKPNTILSGAIFSSATRCFMEGNYYDLIDTTLRPWDAPKTGNVAFIKITCEKPAQAEYYHLVK